MLNMDLLIEQSKQRIAATANSTLTLLFWQVGKRINEEILNNERATYGKQIVATLAQQLENPFFEAMALQYWGEALQNLHKIDQAAEKYLKSLEISEKISTPWMISQNVVSLYSLNSQLAIPEFTRTYDDLITYLSNGPYYDRLSHLQFIQGKQTLQRDFSDSHYYFSEAFVSALRYNWHWLDRVIESIVTIGNELVQADKSKEAVQLFDFLVGFSQNGEVDGIPLSEMEAKVPRIHKGRGSIKETVQERLLRDLNRFSQLS